MGTEKNAEKRSIDEMERQERERWEREERELERQMLDNEWEAERSRAGAWESAKAAILAGTAVIEHDWHSYWRSTGMEPTDGDFTVAPEKRTCRLRITARAWKKPLWSKTARISKEEAERLRTLAASIVLSERKCKPRGVSSGCDGGVWGWSVRVGDETLFSRRFDTLHLPFGSVKWAAEEEAEGNALAPLSKMLREFKKRCEPEEGVLEKIAEERWAKEREREEAAHLGP